MNTVHVTELLENAKMVFHSDDRMLFQIIGEGDYWNATNNLIILQKTRFPPLYSKKDKIKETQTVNIML
jgi:hypothetical protein